MNVMNVYSKNFQTAKVVPLFTEGAKNDTVNYRLINLLSSLSVVFENIFHNQKLRFTQKNNLICLIKYEFGNVLC